MKPIEPGCLAMVIGGDQEGVDAGKVVTVVRFIGSDGPLGHQDLWEVDKALSWRSTLGGDYLRRACPERFLIRIDGFEETEEIQEEAVA